MNKFITDCNNIKNDYGEQLYTKTLSYITNQVPDTEIKKVTFLRKAKHLNVVKKLVEMLYNNMVKFYKNDI